ncbi:MAG: hypothetical protein A2015_06505 [Spirochaetes bacterium GWF1_31_7]|nr:MAG: hypothetical protein A2Y30_08340 [Spirochaetes bacterium GWE1_32_154]OHD51396.1 MAG: hypothetical protein A2Y29_14725 [Spirochaetes bacterium GWE2_31_10]OHD53122.1 MAG: hypothetical protein A2015_06505 [Spirochaetes bacterium GWF1_31_7]OHD82265.1 MAG: hypothetical protein A2355_01005 [Spirochaetes bacterium RIFOXYB1_FULL_32_8]HBD94457.1 hypothetical protein [Spirochaetia bacterium]
MYDSIAPGDEKAASCEYCILFAQTDVMSTEHTMKEILKRFSNIKILPVLGKATFIVMDTLYALNLTKICFEFKPEQVLTELKDFIERFKVLENHKEQRYIINFYENQGVFFIDISGTLKKENLKALRLMFKTYLGDRVKKLRGVVYIFNNTDEQSSSFQTTWTLFRFWEDIGLSFKKIYYLSLSEKITNTIHKYVEPLGTTHLPNLLEVVKTLFPEHSKLNEEELFDIASSLLSDTKKY